MQSLAEWQPPAFKNALMFEVMLLCPSNVVVYTLLRQTVIVRDLSKQNGGLLQVILILHPILQHREGIETRFP